MQRHGDATWSATLALAAALALLATPRAQVDEPVLPGWEAPQDWPAQGITKQEFRTNYGDAWDAVSRTIGGQNRDAEKVRKREELHDMVTATHRKMPLPGASVDRILTGPSTDFVSDDRDYWTLEEAYHTMHNNPYLLNEPGHAGQAIYTAESDSVYGADPVSFRHELDRIALLRRMTYTAETDIEFENDHMLPARVQEMQMSIAMSYHCQEYPSAFSTAAEAYYAVNGEWTQQGRAFLAQAQVLRRKLRLLRPVVQRCQSVAWSIKDVCESVSLDGATEDGARAAFADLDACSEDDTLALGCGDDQLSPEEFEQIVRVQLDVHISQLPSQALTHSFQFIDDDRSGAIHDSEYVAFVQSGKMSCGTANVDNMKQEINRLEARLDELRKRPHDERGMVPFESDAVFDEADACDGSQESELPPPPSAESTPATLGNNLDLEAVGRCGDHLLTMEELNRWAQKAYTRGRNPSAARQGSSRKTQLIEPEGTSSKAPAPGTCAEAVLSACPGTQDEACTACVRQQHGSAEFRGACPTWALVTEACAAGTAATDVYKGLVRDTHWVRSVRCSAVCFWQPVGVAMRRTSAGTATSGITSDI